MCAFYHHSLGGFSIVSVQPCLLQSYSGSKLGQRGFYNYEPQVVGYNILSTCLMLLPAQDRQHIKIRLCSALKSKHTQEEPIYFKVQHYLRRPAVAV